MQQSRSNALSAPHSHQYESESSQPQKHQHQHSSNVKIFPSKPPAHVEQQKRQKRLQRQKEIDGFCNYRRSTSESLPDENLELTEYATSTEVGLSSLTSKKASLNRPVLQRQQRQSSEETESSSVKGNVHFKEVPEYFEVDNRNQLNGIYDTLKNVVTEAGETEADYFGPSSTYAMAERSGIIRGGATRGGSGFFISSNNRNTTTSTVFPAPAEALLGISPTTASACTKVGGSLQLLESESESCTNWAQTFKKHLAQRRALPTTIESFDDEEDSEPNASFLEEGAVSEAEIALEAGGGGGGGSLSYRIEARRKQQHSYYQRGHRGCWTPEKQKQNTTQDPSIRIAAEDLSLNILHSPVASGGVTTSGLQPQQPQRLLPHVPKRFVVPRVSHSEFKKEVSFEDENNAVTHLGGEHGPGPSCSDTNGNEYHAEIPAADLIDVIGPAPTTSSQAESSTNTAVAAASKASINKMVMDNSDVDFYENLLADQVIPDTYTSLPRGRRGRRRNHDFQTQPNTTEYLYGTYRRSKPYTNFATTAFDDEFRTPLNPTNDHHLNGTNNVIAKETNTYQQHQSEYNSEFQQYHHERDYNNQYGNGQVMSGINEPGNGQAFQPEQQDFRENHQGAYLNGPFEDYKHLNGMQNGFSNGGSSYVNEVLNPVEDHYNHPRPSKSVGWANEDNLIQPSHHHESYQEPIEHPAAGNPDILTENGYGMMGPPSHNQQQPDGYLQVYNSNGGSQDQYSYNMQMQQMQHYHDQQQLYNLGAGGNIGSGMEHHSFSSDNHNKMGNHEVNRPVQLTPSWEAQKHASEDHLNFRTLSVSMDRLDLEMNPPVDRLNLIYLTLILHGIGTLMPWNMFVTAKEYFANYKLGKEYTDTPLPYATYFLNYVIFAAQVPNLVFNWINVFLNVGGNLTSRIVWTLLIEVLVFVVTIILAMVDSSEWPGIFFYLTIGCVILLNIASGIYQNTVYGLAAKLPFKYTGAVVLGSNLSGTIVSIISIISLALSPNPRTAAIYYFITALFILLACFDTYFALPLNRFFRYHDHLFNKALHEKKRRSAVHAMPYRTIFKKCFPQCFNVFLTYFVTLTIFPAVLADIKMAHPDFPITEKYFTPVTCFLTFNICAVLGNLIPSLCRFPSPRWLFIPVMLRFLFLPFFLLCNYRPSRVERLWPAMMHWDYGYWIGSALFGLSGGYFSSLGMMYCPRTVEPEYASIAGMFGAASIITGIFAGTGFSYLMPALVSHPSLSFDAPEWWPPYIN